MTDHQVFISYAWGGESEIVANEIESELSAKSIRLIRDKADLGFKGLIREFMEKIGQGNLVVLIISDKYLKSKNCMFELLEVEKKGEFYSRVFPVILPDADIYDSIGIIHYLKYWDEKIKELNARVKELDNLADTRKVQEDINLYTDIRGAIDSLAAKLGNMNTLTLENMRANHYKPLIEGLQEQSEKSSQLLQPISLTKKQGKVLYHIPGMMQVEKWTRCTIRLAWEEILLSEGLKIPEEERVIESIRMGNVMQVSLEEGRNGQDFEIKALNNAEQFIFEDEFTEWLFDVKAKSEGTFTLILRVTLIQIIEGYERKKDIVLERNVKTEALVPEALVKFETAEEGLPAPFIDKKFKGPLILHKMDGYTANPDLKDFKIYPELSEDLDGPKDPPRISNRPPSSSSPVPQSPRMAPPRPGSPPKPTGPGFRKILPYAASFAAIAVVGILFFSERGNQSPSSEDDYVAYAPDNSVQEDGYRGEKLVIAMSLDATAPSGEQVTEVMLFIIHADQMDSLVFLNPENYSMQAFPASDTVSLNLRPIRNFTIMEIQDSVKKASARPSVVGNQLIDKSQLQINPGTQILSTRPQQLDSSTSKKLRMGSKNLREY